MRKLYVSAMVAMVSVLAFATTALAAPGDPPTFDTNTLSPVINDFASALLVGVVILIGVVLVAIVPFVLVKLGIRYIKKWFGAGKATNTA